MEVVEIVVYFSAAVIVGMLLTGIFTGWNYKEAYNTMKSWILGDDSTNFKKLGKDASYLSIYQFYQDCVKNTINITSRIYIEDTGKLTKSDIFGHFKSLEWCNSIQSRENDCGEREDIIMLDIDIPSVITIRCINNKYIQIE